MEIWNDLVHLRTSGDAPLLTRSSPKRIDSSSGAPCTTSRRLWLYFVPTALLWMALHQWFSTLLQKLCQQGQRVKAMQFFNTSLNWIIFPLRIRTFMWLSGGYLLQYHSPFFCTVCDLHFLWKKLWFFWSRRLLRKLGSRFRQWWG